VRPLESSDAPHDERADVHRRDQSDPRLITLLLRALPDCASGNDQPEGTHNDVGDSAHYLHPDVGTEDGLAHDIHAPTSALDVLERALAS